MGAGFLSPFVKGKQRDRSNSASSIHSAISLTPSTTSDTTASSKEPKKKPSFLLLPPKVKFSDTSSASSFGTNTSSSYASSGPPTPNAYSEDGFAPLPSPHVSQTRFKLGETQVKSGSSAASGASSLEARRQARKEEKRRKEKDPVYQGLKSLGLWGW